MFVVLQVLQAVVSVPYKIMSNSYCWDISIKGQVFIITVVVVFTELLRSCFSMSGVMIVLIRGAGGKVKVLISMCH